jgi:hypothetical protein
MELMECVTKSEVRELSIDRHQGLRTLNPIFLADEDQSDGSRNNDDQSASKQAINEIT